MGAVASTMSWRDAPTMYPAACLDILNAVESDGDMLLWPTVLVHDVPAEWPWMPRRLTISARTAPAGRGSP